MSELGAHVQRPSAQLFQQRPVAAETPGPLDDTETVHTHGSALVIRVLIHLTILTYVYITVASTVHLSKWLQVSESFLRHIL